MKFNEDKARYSFTKFIGATEELMRTSSVSEFVKYLEQYAELEEKEANGNRIFLLNETQNLHKEFIVTEDGKLFWWISLNDKVELVNNEEKKIMPATKEQERKALDSKAVHAATHEISNKKDAEIAALRERILSPNELPHVIQLVTEKHRSIETEPKNAAASAGTRPDPGGQGTLPADVRRGADAG